MNALLQFLIGKKTYLTVLTIGVLLFGAWQAWWTIPNEIYLALMALALAFLRNGINNPPPTGGTGGPGNSAEPGFKLPSMLAFVCCMFIFTGCAPLQPGADPIVVRTEQAETVGKAAFDLILHVDDSNRSFFATNEPPFHEFCQWLRVPQTIEGTNTQPRAISLILSLDDVKLDYQHGRTSSNALDVACTTFQGLVSQAQAWSNVILPQKPPTP